VLKFYGKHIDQRAEHLQGLQDEARQPQPEPRKKKGGENGKDGRQPEAEAKGKEGSTKGKNASQPQPEPKGKKSSTERKKGRQPESEHEGENPHGLKVIGNVLPRGPEPQSKRRKRDAG